MITKKKCTAKPAQHNNRQGDWEVSCDEMTLLAHLYQGGSMDSLEIRKSRNPKANAEFVADAFNTYNITGLTPSQLLKQRDELLAVAKRFADFPCDDWETCKCRHCTLKRAIKSASN